MHQSEFYLYDPDSILADLEKAVRAAQAAALARRLSELRHASAQQTELCGQLHTCLNGTKGKSAGLNRAALDAVRRLHLKVRVLSAVLRRMQKNFSIMRNAMAGVSLSYRPGTDEMRAGV